MQEGFFCYTSTHVLGMGAFGNKGTVAFVLQDTLEERQIPSLLNRIRFNYHDIALLGALQVTHVDVHRYPGH